MDNLFESLLHWKVYNASTKLALLLVIVDIRHGVMCYKSKP